MKKALLTLALFSSIYSFSQDYIPMLQDENIWQININYEQTSDPENECCGSYVKNIEVVGEEIINGLVYTIVTAQEDGIACYLREEDQIIYKWNEFNNQEFVLIDFNLEEGDTFNLNESAYRNYSCELVGEYSFEPSLTVASVTYVNIAGANRKLITFQEESVLGIPLQWIEGIGNITGFDNIFYVELTGFYSYGQLRCFTKNEDTYQFNGFKNCSILNISNFNLDDIYISPNPIQETSKLNLPKNANANLLKIYSINGKIIQESKVTTTNVEINSKDLASGLYFCQIYSNNQLLKTEKFIIK